MQDLFNVHSTLRDDRVVHFSGYEARVPKRVGARRRRTEAAWPCMRAAGFSNANDEIKLSINEGRRVLSPPPLSNDALFVVLDGTWVSLLQTKTLQQRIVTTVNGVDTRLGSARAAGVSFQASRPACLRGRFELHCLSPLLAVAQAMTLTLFQTRTTS